MLSSVCGVRDRTTTFHGIELVGVAHFRVLDNMEGQTSGGVRVVQTVGPEGQEDDQHEGAVDQTVSVSTVHSVKTTSQLDLLSVTSLRWKFRTHNLSEKGRKVELIE